MSVRVRPWAPLNSKKGLFTILFSLQYMLMKNIGPFKLYTKKPNDIKYGKIYYMEVLLPILYSKKRIVRVYLPENYNKNKKYPVLFMADGQNIVDKYTSAYGAWDIDVHQHNLIKEKYPSFIVVGIDCPINPIHRALEYSFPFMKMNPQEEGKELTKSSLKFESHLLYKYIAEDLLPLVREYFSISNNKEDIGVGGSSMGGIFSTSLICSYPETFGFALIFSPGYFLYSKKELSNYLLSNMDKLKDHKLFFYSGNVGFESKFLKRTVDAYNLFQSHGFDDKHIHLLLDYDAEHNEPSWSLHFEDTMKFFFSKK